MKKFLIAALLAGVATSSFAADLPTHKGPPPMAPIYAPAFSWTGFYLGVNGGYADRIMSGNTNFGSESGGMIGVTAGYNYQFGQLVAGVEGDADWMFTDKTAGYVNGINKYTTNTMTTERLRLGYAMDRTLLYITGGYAGIQTKGSFNDTVFGFSGSQHDWRSGGVIGGGVEYAFTNNITAKIEYLYAPMGSQTYFAGTPDVEKSDMNLSIVRAGLNYKF
jgi:outer membrane immunogenic protein